MSTVPERSYTSHNYIAPNFYQDPSKSHRSIGIGHVTITPHNEDGNVGLLLVDEHDPKYPVAYPVRCNCTSSRTGAVSSFMIISA